MDEDLLDKYFAGKCTPEEEASVKSWLNQPVTKENELLAKSWRNIRTHMLTGKVQPFHIPSRYFAAASIALLTIFCMVWKLTSQDFVVHNTSHHYEAFEAKGLQFRLPPKGAAHVNSNFSASTADLIFCGNVRIQNNSSDDVDVKLNLNCANTGPSDHVATLKVLKDKKYLAFQYYFKSEELVIVEEDRIFDLPLPLQEKALKMLEI